MSSILTGIIMLSLVGVFVVVDVVTSTFVNILTSPQASSIAFSPIRGYHRNYSRNGENSNHTNSSNTSILTASNNP